MMKTSQIILSIGIFVSSQIVMGASFNLEEQRNSLDPLKILAPIEEISNDSILDPALENYQQIIITRQQAYFEILKLLKNNQLDLAEDKIHILLKQHPKVSELNNLKAVLNLLKKNNELAIKGFQNLLI